MINIEEKLDDSNQYAIFIDNKKVFSIGENTQVDNDILNECLNIMTLLNQVYEYGKQNIDIRFGIR